MSVLYTPKKFKSLRIHKNPKFGVITNNKHRVGFNNIIARGFGHLNWRNIEAGRRSLTKQVRRKIQVWVKIRLTQPVTSKPKQSRMGKGKGKFKGWIGYIQPGRLMYNVGYTTVGAIELSSDINSIYTRKLPLKKIQQKFPFPVEVVEKQYKYNFIKKSNFSTVKKYESLFTGYKKYKRKQFNFFTAYHFKIDRDDPAYRKKRKRLRRISNFKKIKLQKKIKKENKDKKIFFFSLKNILF